MRISFTGPGCSGKTTLLKKCREHYGDKFDYVDEVTRPALHSGLKINEDGDSSTQLYILEQHIRNDSLDNVIMDRCIIDGLVYTNWLHMEGKVSDTVQRTFDKAYKELVNNLDIVFYTSPVQFQDDGERSTNTKFITDIEQMFENVIWSMETCDKSPLVIHLNGEFATRFNYIKIAIEQHEHSTIG
jgi:nicotinamide riboside kinase